MTDLENSLFLFTIWSCAHKKINYSSMAFQKTDIPLHVYAFEAFLASVILLSSCQGHMTIAQDYFSSKYVEDVIRTIIKTDGPFGGVLMV